MPVGKLVWVAAGFTAAVLGAEYFLPVSGLPYFAAALAVLSLPALFLPKKRRAPVMAAVLSAVLGLLCWWNCYQRHVAPCEALVGQDVTIRARVTDYPQTAEDYSRITVRILDGAPRERAVIYLYDGELPALQPGDIIETEIRVRPVMEREQTKLHSNTSSGIYMRGYVRDEIRTVGRWDGAWMYFPQELARRVKEICGELFPGRSGVFMTALLTGDKQALYEDVELYGDMRASGILHIVAVSGMHVFILLSFVDLLFGRRRWARLLCLPLIAVFVLMTGAGASVVRAAIMQTLFVCAPLFGRESDSLSAISCALLLELLWNPMAIGGVSLQLSYACVVGMALCTPRLYELTDRPFFKRNRLIRYLRGSVITSIGAVALSLPLSVFYFGAIPLLALLANALLLPVVEFCFAGGYVLCAVYAVFPALAGWGAFILRLGIGWCILVVRLLGRLPFSCLYTENPFAVPWLVLVYALVIWCIIRRKRRRYLHLGIPLGLGIISLCAVFLGSYGGHMLIGKPTVAVLDVGQGECVCVYDRNTAVVVDCGGTGLMNAGDNAADHLCSVGVKQVDALFLTHLHEDHTNGVEALLYRIPVKRLYIPADADDSDGTLEEILAAAERYGTDVFPVSEAGALVLEELTVTLALPQADGGENERGMVVLAAFPEMKTLIMGDAGTDAELALLGQGFAPDVDCLVVGHHGSQTASGALFLRLVRAETAVISVGAGNSYGLPSEETVERLETYAENVYRTDADGTVLYRGG